ncbi:peptidyl-tRNA hydrolase [Streptomyces fradiae]|uniref:peptidyl-tRNA hydrolase n=1 Tax=Streptomyces fradiae TaxID=1906 RepID=UPI003F4CC13A
MLARERPPAPARQRGGWQTGRVSSENVTGADDRDTAPQFVLPLVVRIEKAAPPARTDALETAARAVLVMLSDERSTGDGPWARAVRDWEDARIRKVVRRARGAEWRRAALLPGVTVTGEEAEVRVFPPVPLDGWPKDLARLQVSGTELDDPAVPPPPAPGGAVLWLNPELRMSAGKEMAQAGHGAQLLWWALDGAARAAWREAGFPLAVRTALPGRWAELVASGRPVVRDAGFTEIAPGSATVVSDFTPAAAAPPERPGTSGAAPAGTPAGATAGAPAASDAERPAPPA